MRNITSEILKEVGALKTHLLTISEEEAKRKPAPDKWSKQEILGHLIDSCYNNIHRIVRGRYDKARAFPAYEQNEWVAAQNYNQAGWHEIIELFTLNNYQFCRAVDNLPEETFKNECDNGHGVFTLEFIVADYLSHMKHHIAQLVLNKETISV